MQSHGREHLVKDFMTKNVITISIAFIEMGIDIND